METARKVLDRLAGREYHPPLKPYMAYGREGGPQECAVLVFAPTAKVAKKIAWEGAKSELTDEYTDLAVNLERGKEFLFADADQEKLYLRIPHLIMDPTCCKSCEHWGMKLNEQGLCEGCVSGIEVWEG